MNNFQELIDKNMIVKHRAGSHAYGTALPSSDTDHRGIFCAEPINILTPFFNVEEVSDKTEEDTKFYELTHFMRLCVNCNPNIIESLWVDESDIVIDTPAYRYLRENRKAMLSSKIAFTTSGYALAQLKKIKGHNKWINNPQTIEPPKQTDFVSLVQWFGDDKNLKFHLKEFRNNHRLIPYGHHIYGLVPWDGYQTFSDDFTLNIVYEEPHHKAGFPIAILKFNSEVYKRAKQTHSQYWEWKKNRNKTRGELEEKFGYDTKHAMHLVRLLRMGVEALTTGEIIVKRPDAAELLEIRNGAWSYNKIVDYANHMDELVRGKLYNETKLPYKSNPHEVAKILMTTQKIIWGNDGI